MLKKKKKSTYREDLKKIKAETNVNNKLKKKKKITSTSKIQ